MFDDITKSILAQGNGLKRDPETGVLYEEPLKEEHPIGNLLLLRGSGPALAKGLQWIGEKAMPSVLLKGIGQTFPKLTKVTTAVSPYADAGAMAIWGAAGLETGKQGIKEGDAAKAVAGYTMAAMPVIGVNPEIPVNKANKVARALNKEVKSTEIADSPVTQNILAGKLGWAPKQNKVIWHNSESPISKLDHTFPAWDVIKRDAPLGHVWGTGTETKQGFIGIRPFHLRSTQPVEMNKPMVQLNESIGNGKNAVRNEILKFADQSGADAVHFNNINDNTLSNQDVYAIFKDVVLDPDKSIEIPIFTKSPIVKSIYTKPAASFTSISTKDTFMSDPEYLTKDHIPFSIEILKPNYTEGYRMQTTIPQKQKSVETNFQNFLNKSDSEKDEIVRYWYGEKYSSFKELEQNSKDFNSFKRYINGIKKPSKRKQGGILKAQRGAFEDFWNTLPQNQQDSIDFNIRRYWELNGKPINFKEAIKRGMYKKEQDGYHANSVAFNKETGEYEFMKSPNHPTIQYELDWFNSNKAKNFRNKYQLDSTSIPWKYVPKHK